MYKYCATICHYRKGCYLISLKIFYLNLFHTYSISSI